MTVIKGNGAPGKRTFGSVNDIYIDSVTGKQYVCVSAYTYSFGLGDYEWKATTQAIDIPEEKTNTELINEEPETLPETSRTNYRKSYGKCYKPNRN